MKMKVFFGLLMVCDLKVCGYADDSPDDGLKLEYVRYATKCMRPCEFENQSYWSNAWSVAAVFFDLNRDGCLDAIVATSDQQVDKRFDWLPMQKNHDGNISIKDGIGENVFVGCYPFAVYKATMSGGVNLLVGRDCSIDKYESGKRVWFKQPYDLIFHTDKAGCHSPQIDQFMIDKVVRNPDFIRLERVEPSWYLGYELKLAPPDKRRAIPNNENLPNGGLAVPGDFKAFARHYRNEVKQRLGIEKPVAVYAVFFDADLDGDADCYVSSDAETAEDGKYRWTLYINDENKFGKATGRMWINRGTIHDIAMLEPEDVAPKHAFYRVVRTYGSAQILVMEFDGNRLHTHAYTNLLSEQDRRNCPPKDRYRLKDGQQSFDEWEGEMNAKYGFAPPKDFRDQVSLLSFHHLERLPCLEYPEDLAASE